MESPRRPVAGEHQGWGVRAGLPRSLAGQGHAREFRIALATAQRRDPCDGLPTGRRLVRNTPVPQQGPTLEHRTLGEPGRDRVVGTRGSARVGPSSPSIHQLRGFMRWAPHLAWPDPGRTEFTAFSFTATMGRFFGAGAEATYAPHRRSRQSRLPLTHCDIVESRYQGADSGTAAGTVLDTISTRAQRRGSRNGHFLVRNAQVRLGQDSA